MKEEIEQLLLESHIMIMRCFRGIVNVDECAEIRELQQRLEDKIKEQKEKWQSIKSSIKFGIKLQNKIM